MEKRGQISVEYIMIIAVALMIILPGIYLFRNYIFESNDKLLETRLNEVANQIISKAMKMHYYGPPSKTTIQVEMPPQVEQVYIQSVPSNNEYYLVFKIATSSGTHDYDYQSDVPLKAGEAVACPPDYPADSQCFPERYSSKGMKNMRLQSTDVCSPPLEFCVEVREISDITS